MYVLFSRLRNAATSSVVPLLTRLRMCTGQAWQAVFAFALLGSIFLLWIMVMAYQVFANEA